MPEDSKNQPTVKGALTARRIKVQGFRGAYLDARFSDDGVSEEPVSPATESAFKSQFPKAKVTAVSDKAPAGEQTEQ